MSEWSEGEREERGKRERERRGGRVREGEERWERGEDKKIRE